MEGHNQDNQDIKFIAIIKNGILIQYIRLKNLQVIDIDT